VLWAVIQPTMYMVVFTIVFGKMVKVPTDGIPYPLFSFSALTLWNFFAVGIAQAGNNLVMRSSFLLVI
jgi:lipopolysaccharide transport system permease protein